MQSSSNILLNFNYFDNFLNYVPLPIVIFIKLTLVVAVAFLALKLGLYVIKNIYNKSKDINNKLNSKKANTINTLTTSAYKYTIYLIAVIAGLSIIFNSPFDLKSVIAAAGIGGIALGFGAQSLVKDFISGFFIIIEDHYSVGDMITIDTMTGMVEQMELRVTRIRNVNGDLYIIPNGDIKRLTNHTRGNKAFYVDIQVSQCTEAKIAIECINIACKRVTEQFENLPEVPSLLGITEFTKEFCTFRITGKALPLKQWEVERSLRLAVKEEFETKKVIL